VTGETVTATGSSGPLTAKPAKSAEEWFITDAVQEIVPVAWLACRPYTVPGETSARLTRAYRELVVQETAPA
jgi:branched-subunit amino acid aminotransferase/4-amino-4-deoxychorismate lyase